MLGAVVEAALESSPGRAALQRELEAYRARHPERASVADGMLELLRKPGAFARDHLAPGHFTASAFVLCPERRELLMVHHAKLDRWLQPGGHIEPSDVSALSAASREVSEETGVSGLSPLEAGIFDIDVHDIPARPKEGAHQHFDVRYAFVARSAELIASAEVRGARWVPLGDVEALNPEESIVRCVRGLRERLGR